MNAPEGRDPGHPANRRSSGPARLRHGAGDHPAGRRLSRLPGRRSQSKRFSIPHPVRGRGGVDIHTLVVEEDKSRCLDPILRAARKLEWMGCRAIAAECGYFAWFQREVAASVEVPVFMSSLLQVPLAQQLIGRDRVVGILMAQARYLTDHHLESVGIQLGTNYVIGGAMDDLRCEEFDHLWTGACGRTRLQRSTTRLRPSSWRWAASSSINIPPWAPWCWNAPACRPSRAPCSEPSISRCSVGAPCWIMPIL